MSDVSFDKDKQFFNFPLTLGQIYDVAVNQVDSVESMADLYWMTGYIQALSELPEDEIDEDYKNFLSAIEDLYNQAKEKLATVH